MCKKIEYVDYNLKTLSYDTLIARKECSLMAANSCMVMAKIYERIGEIQAMKRCAQDGIRAIKEYKKVDEYLKQDTTGTIEYKKAA